MMRSQVYEEASSLDQRIVDLQSQLDRLTASLQLWREQQDHLKPAEDRVAELTRTALREMGANFTGTAGDFSFSSVLNATGAASAILTSQQVQLTLSAVSSNHMAFCSESCRQSFMVRYRQGNGWREIR